MLFTMSCLCGMMCDVSCWLGDLIMAAIIFLTPKHWMTVSEATHIFIIPLMDSVGPTESTLSHSNASIWEETPTRRDTSLVRRKLSVKFYFAFLSCVLALGCEITTQLYFVQKPGKTSDTSQQMLEREKKEINTVHADQEEDPGLACPVNTSYYNEIGIWIKKL